MKRFALTPVGVFWLLLSVAAEFTGWVDSAKYISRLSEVALVLSSAAAWQGSRTEVKQDETGSE